uniref:Uncharacterized protein n=1 Tax=Arundo donax TaxID=35708 RepID=A0A0A8YF50_ARUDO
MQLVVIWTLFNCQKYHLSTYIFFLKTSEEGLTPNI